MILPVLGALVIVFALGMYVLLDGFDLGVGILLLTSRNEAQRDAMVESIAPIWDGNETWLILVGVTLLAAFPIAYSTVLPALYLPVLIMLIALGFRGISFEFRFQTTRYRKIWDAAFSCGSTVAAFCQGLIVGSALNGLPADIAASDRGPFSFLSGFGLLTAVTTVVGYAMLGAAWLNWRTNDSLQKRAAIAFRRASCIFALLACLCIAALVTGASPAAQAWIEHRPMFVGLGVVAGALWILCWRAIGNAPGRARLYASALIGVFLVGIVLIVWPFIVPFSITIWDASAPPGSQLLLLGGIACMLPAVLGNAVYVYWTFRRKPLAAANER
ncbi:MULTISPECIES: cytochrome d ubiquinol oxidase subunit II [unclassified Bradyrhizobium]|uniref:cytochrome d ubiquinol oxidase subunit II n=1 Tax=unclassified Bradyrhizobium TaxID=2631580 RepID=UPI002478F452|nr:MULTISPECIES: cytochrome d ubiquinol oxidase subunit II [unclassified Bradyrhizobium]WGR73190.1 cytochrome d ubiquinol oxidase subunit II [Bradyrhizobium sp. ISRA426]WGR78029.1 cytochrome d ubiquinol oxidase subunit II [Bradyrhizobium sp. ISRA430]WGR88430.1 cytochrome d ubiquinol oxidase subunit II [Bradyrhizobium sp. ISRA432]